MLVAVGIVMVLMAISAGAYTQLREAATVETAKEEVVSILQQTRLMALSRRSNQTVTINYATAALNPNTISGPTTGPTPHSFAPAIIQAYTCGTCSVAAGTPVDTINFTPRGTVTTLTLQVSSAGGGEVFYVLLNPVTGRVDVRRGCNAGVCS